MYWAFVFSIASKIRLGSLSRPRFIEYPFGYAASSFLSFKAGEYEPGKNSIPQALLTYIKS